METLRNVENQNHYVTKPVDLKNRAVRKPLRGLENKVRNIPVKASFKDKPKFAIAKENVDSNLLKPIKTRADAKKVLESVQEIKKDLPIIIESHSSSQLPENVNDIDAEDAKNPQLVSIYVNDIYSYMRQLEVLYPIKERHLQNQPEITGKMRAVLIDWLIQVHLRFHLLQETLYLTVSILDQYLQVEKVKRSELQLVGVTAMFIASKYEEMYSPEIGDFVYITDNTYSKQEIFKMERAMLRKLDFNLSKPLPLHFLRRNSKAGDVDATMHTLAKYLMEISLPEYELAHYRPSQLAAAALYLSLKLLTKYEWSETLKYYSKYSEEDILPLVKSLCRVLLKADVSKLQAVHLKYSSSKLYKISTIPQLKSPVVKEFAGVKK